MNLSVQTPGVTLNTATPPAQRPETKAAVRFGEDLQQDHGVFQSEISKMYPPVSGYNKLPVRISLKRIDNWPLMEMYTATSPSHAAWGMKFKLSRKPTVIGIDGHGIHWDASTSLIGSASYQNDIPYSDIVNLDLHKGHFSNTITIQGRQDGTIRFPYLDKDSSEKLFAVLKKRYQHFTNRNHYVPPRQF